MSPIVHWGAGLAAHCSIARTGLRSLPVAALLTLLSGGFMPPAQAQRRMPVITPPQPAAPVPLSVPLSQPATTAVAAPVAPLTPAPARLNTGLVTIESDLQRADQLTGVVTATGNVRIVYPDQRVVATARQAQYYSKEGRVVLSGEVDVVQEGGNLLRAEQVVYLVNGERLLAIPPQGRQVFSRMRIPSEPAPQSQAPVGVQP